MKVEKKHWNSWQSWTKLKVHDKVVRFRKVFHESCRKLLEFMQIWYNHACIIDYSILTHLTSITGRYLYPKWIEDRLEKWKWIKTNLFNKQVENIFFFPRIIPHDTYTRTAFRNAFPQNSFTKHFYFYCYPQLEKCSSGLFFIFSSYSLQSLMPFITHFFYYSFFSCSLLNMCMCVYVQTYIQYTCIIIVTLDCIIFALIFLCVVGRKTGQEY